VTPRDPNSQRDDHSHVHVRRDASPRGARRAADPFSLSPVNLHPIHDSTTGTRTCLPSPFLEPRYRAIENMSSEDEGPAKKRRAQRACDICRRRKSAWRHSAHSTHGALNFAQFDVSELEIRV
jgi:hypothetical protein